MGCGIGWVGIPCKPWFHCLHSLVLTRLELTCVIVCRCVRRLRITDPEFKVLGGTVRPLAPVQSPFPHTVVRTQFTPNLCTLHPYYVHPYIRTHNQASCESEVLCFTICLLLLHLLSRFSIEAFKTYILLFLYLLSEPPSLALPSSIVQASNVQASVVPLNSLPIAFISLLHICQVLTSLCDVMLCNV